MYNNAVKNQSVLCWIYNKGFLDVYMTFELTPIPWAYAAFEKGGVEI